MKSEVIETRVAKIWLGADGILCNTFIPKAEVTLDDAIEIAEANARVTEGMKTALLVDARQVKSATREARMFASRDEIVQYRSAVAVLVSSPLSMTLGNFFTGFNKPPYPTRLFTSETKAIEWLTGFLD